MIGTRNGKRLACKQTVGQPQNKGFVLFTVIVFQNKALAELQSFQKTVAAKVAKYNWEEYKDEQLKRRLQKMADIGTSALKDEDKLAKVCMMRNYVSSTWGEHYPKQRFILATTDIHMFSA